MSIFLKSAEMNKYASTLTRGHGLLRAQNTHK